MCADDEPLIDRPLLSDPLLAGDCMNIVISLFLASIIALLFYRVVERRHKIVFAKIVAGVVFLVGLGAGGIGLYNSQTAGTEQSGVGDRRGLQLRVEFIPESTSRIPPYRYFDTTYTTDADRIAFRVCNPGSDTVGSFKIHAVTWTAGHSLPVPVIPWLRPHSKKPRELDSDLVLRPYTCEIVSFAGLWVVRDSVSASAEGFSPFPGFPR